MTTAQYVMTFFTAFLFVVLGLAYWFSRSGEPEYLTPEQKVARKKAIQSLWRGKSVRVVSDDAIITISSGNRAFYFETMPSRQFHDAEQAVCAAEDSLKYVVSYEVSDVS